METVLFRGIDTFIKQQSLKGDVLQHLQQLMCYLNTCQRIEKEMPCMHHAIIVQ